MQIKGGIPEGIVSESVESRLLHSASGFSAPLSCGTIRPGWGAKMADVTTALCAEREKLFSGGPITWELRNKAAYIKRCLPLSINTVTFNPFPEVIAVPPYRCEFTQVMVSAPDVYVLVLWAAYNEGVVVTTGKRPNRFTATYCVNTTTTTTERAFVHA